MGGLDCVSCVSNGLCVCSLVTLIVLCVCVFHLLRFVCCLVRRRSFGSDRSFRQRSTQLKLNSTQRAAATSQAPPRRSLVRAHFLPDRKTQNLVKGEQWPRIGPLRPTLPFPLPLPVLMGNHNTLAATATSSVAVPRPTHLLPALSFAVVRRWPLGAQCCWQRCLPSACASCERCLPSHSHDGAYLIISSISRAPQSAKRKMGGLLGSEHFACACALDVEERKLEQTGTMRCGRKRANKDKVAVPPRRSPDVAQRNMSKSIFACSRNDLREPHLHHCWRACTLTRWLPMIFSMSVGSGQRSPPYVAWSRVWSTPCITLAPLKTRASPDSKSTVSSPT